MQPLTNYLPKPMLPLGRKPVIEHIIEELNGAGLDEIVVVIRSGFESVVEYFAETPGISFLADDSAGGPGKAILKAREKIREEPVAVVFSDAPLGGGNRSRHLRQMMEQQQRTGADAMLSVYRVPSGEARRRGIVSFKEYGAEPGARPVQDILEKPDQEFSEPQWASTGRYLLPPDIFEALEKTEPDENGEVQLTHGVRRLMQEGKSIYGISLEADLKRYDTGNFENYFEAFCDIAVRGPN